MVKILATYSGGLHCKLVHVPSGSQLETDAPKDNQGKGEHFSPTDLLGASLASCILTTLAIVAERDGVSLVGATAEAEKEMIPQPRRVGSLRVKITLPRHLNPEYRKKMEHSAASCPVKKSLNADIDTSLSFTYL